MHIIETIKKGKGEQITAAFSWNN